MPPASGGMNPRAATGVRPPPPPTAMKLRIKGDSIRLRQTQTEVRSLAETGAVESAMRVSPEAELVYGLRASGADTLTVQMSARGVTVLVPEAWIDPWAEGDDVGFDGEQDAGDGRTLAILVEKDFACLHKRPDELDAFPNPLADSV